MKRKLKGILLAMCMAVITLAMPMCVYAEEAAVSDSDRATIESFAQQTVEQITSMTDEQMDEIMKPSSILTAPNKFFVEAVQAWQDVRDELGAFKATTGHDIEVSEDNIVVTTNVTFEKADGAVVLTIGREDLAPSSMTFDTGADSSMAAKMEKAALNTLMGLVIVFVMLVFLSFLISQFKHFGKLENRGKKNENELDVAAKAIPVPVAPVQEEELADDGELVAVIAAAIAASENTSTDSFVVRSIRKANKRKWQNA
ncbi:MULTISPECIES: OadG family transporter subunit [Robinsoniella]|uniref:OadG family transporter subunit n=1 Tax=Robinsoniella TaxID=588605 RepID=UPI00069323E4|nr:MULTISPECIES: OadG family transporter subunit [Robinsoniella]